MSAHTKTPWHVRVDENYLRPGVLSGVYIDRADGSCVAETFSNCGQTDAKCRANAAFIVRAVNAHDDLVDALRDEVDFLEGFEDVDCEETSATIAALLAKKRAAIAKAGAA